MTQSLNQQKLDVLRVLRAMAIDNHKMKLEALDADIANLEVIVDMEREQREKIGKDSPKQKEFEMKIDLRPRCARARCHKLITKGKMAQDNFKRYQPYCSYHCQHWAGLEMAQAHITAIRDNQP